jgi:PleD family two-component response regulator
MLCCTLHCHARQWRARPSNHRGSPCARTVLVIDDQTSNALLVAEILSGISTDIDVVTFAQPLEAVRYAAENPLDLVLTDFSMPELDGLGVIRLLKQMEHHIDLPIVVVTALDDMSIRYAALDAGAADFLTRPINHRECQSRCRNLLRMHMFQRQIKQHSDILEQRVAEVSEDLQSRSMEMLRRLAVVAEKA